MVNWLCFLAWLNCFSLKLLFSKLTIKSLSRLTSCSFSPCFRCLWTRSHACAWCLRSNICLIYSIILNYLTFWSHYFDLCNVFLIKFRLISLFFEHLVFVVILSFCQSDIHFMHALNLLNLVFDKIINDFDRDWVVFVNMVLCSNMISMLCNNWTLFAFN